MTDRILYVQSDRWHRVHAGIQTDVYSATRCSYCARPTRPDAARLRTARTNDGEWWLVSEGIDLTADEWRDFQTQNDNSRGPTLLPIGPDCLRKNPEFRLALLDASCRLVPAEGGGE